MSVIHCRYTHEAFIFQTIHSLHGGASKGGGCMDIGTPGGIREENMK